MYNRLQTLIALVVHPVSSLHIPPHAPPSLPLNHNLISHVIPAPRCQLIALIWENSHFSMLWNVKPLKSPCFHGCEIGLFLLITHITNYWPWKGPFFCCEVPYPQPTLHYVFILDEFRFGGVWICYIRFCLVRLVFVTSVHFLHILRSAPIYGTH
jgi:hypothetical protein